jgi:hypothetical protein
MSNNKLTPIYVEGGAVKSNASEEKQESNAETNNELIISAFRWAVLVMVIGVFCSLAIAYSDWKRSEVVKKIGNAIIERGYAKEGNEFIVQNRVCDSEETLEQCLYLYSGKILPKQQLSLVGRN